MALTNQAKNTGTIVNQEFGGSGITFAEITDSFENVDGPFSNPYSISNQTKNTGTITNQSQS
jgi:hypothetical protein